MPDARFQSPSPLSEKELDEIESLLGSPLPDDYRKFATKYAGAFVGGAVDGDDGLSVDYFDGAGDNNNIFWSLRNEDDFCREGFLPVAGCILGNRFVLDARDPNGKIHFINYYGDRRFNLKVSDTFQDFVDRIVIVEED